MRSLCRRRHSQTREPPFFTGEVCFFQCFHARLKKNITISQRISRGIIVRHLSAKIETALVKTLVPHSNIASVTFGGCAKVWRTQSNSSLQTAEAVYEFQKRLKESMLVRSAWMTVAIGEMTTVLSVYRALRLQQSAVLSRPGFARKQSAVDCGDYLKPTVTTLTHILRQKKLPESDSH